MTTTTKLKTFASTIAALLVLFTAAPARAFDVNTDLNQVVDVTAEELERFYEESGHVYMKGTGNAFVEAGKKYGINAVYIMAHAVHETGWGDNDLPRYKKNWFGYGAFDRCPYTCAVTYPTHEAGIDQVMAKVKADYLTSGGQFAHGPNLAGMNVAYATDKNWKNAIASYMNSFESWRGRDVISREERERELREKAASTSVALRDQANKSFSAATSKAKSALPIFSVFDLTASIGAGFEQFEALKGPEGIKFLAEAREAELKRVAARRAGIEDRISRIEGAQATLASWKQNKWVGWAVKLADKVFRFSDAYDKMLAQLQDLLPGLDLAKADLDQLENLLASALETETRSKDFEAKLKAEGPEAALGMVGSR